MAEEHPIVIKFGRRVRELRKDAGLSQVDLGRAAALDRTYIGGIERGERNLSLANIASLAKALKVSLETLFKGLR